MNPVGISNIKFNKFNQSKQKPNNIKLIKATTEEEDQQRARCRRGLV